MSQSTPVLLVMDFQHGIVERIGDPEVVAAAGRAVEAARSAGIPVMFVRVAFRPGYPEVADANLSFSRLAESGDTMTHDHPGTQVHAELEPRADEPVVVKRRVSAFAGSDLDVLLRAAGADSLVLAGIATSGVVLSTLRHAADADYRIIVVSDCCSDSDPDVHRCLMEKVFPRQATVMSADQVMPALASAAVGGDI